MNAIKESVENLLDTIEGLLETHRDLIILKFLQRFSTSASMVVIGIFGLLLLLLVLIFLGVGMSLWIGEYLDNIKVGFIIVGGVYILLLGIVVLLARKVLLPRIRDLIIDKIYDDDQEL
jgi:hypothetical protein